MYNNTNTASIVDIIAEDTDNYNLIIAYLSILNTNSCRQRSSERTVRTKE